MLLVGTFSALYGLVMAGALFVFLTSGPVWENSITAETPPTGPLHVSAYTAAVAAVATWFFTVRFALTDKLDGAASTLNAVLVFVLCIPTGFAMTLFGARTGYLLDSSPTVVSEPVAWLYCAGTVIAHIALGVAYAVMFHRADAPSPARRAP